MEESPLIKKMLPNTKHFTNHQATVVGYINPNNH